MSVQVLLNVLNELGKINKIRGLPSILSLFVTRLINSIIQDVRFYQSYDILMTLKSHFRREKKDRFRHYVRNVVMDV